MLHGKDGSELKLNFEFKEEEVYDDKANVTFSRLSESNREIIAQIGEKNEDIPTDLIDIIVGIHTSDEKVMANMNRVANASDEVYIRECRREWDRLWDYFDVSEYKECCFPKGKGLSLTFSEKIFLGDFFEEVCRPAKDYPVEANKKERREVRSFLDRRKKNFDEDDKDKIQWAATNLYQMIRRRVGITEEIREKFFEVTKDKSYVTAKKFDDIKNSIKMAEKLAYGNNGADCLSIKEKELWAERLADELKEVINKWNDIFTAMDSLKYENEDKYQGIIKPERLLEDAIKQEREIE